MFSLLFYSCFSWIIMSKKHVFCLTLSFLNQLLLWLAWCQAWLGCQSNVPQTGISSTAAVTSSPHRWSLGETVRHIVRGKEHTLPSSTPLRSRYITDLHSGRFNMFKCDWHRGGCFIGYDPLLSSLESSRKVFLWNTLH